MKTITYNDNTLDLILTMFNKSVDKDGYVVESETGKRVLTPNGDEVRKEEFAGFVPGSEIVLTKDLPSLLQYANMES